MDRNHDAEVEAPSVSAEMQYGQNRYGGNCTDGDQPDLTKSSRSMEKRGTEYEVYENAGRRITHVYVNCFEGKVRRSSVNPRNPGQRSHLESVRTD